MYFLPENNYYCQSLFPSLHLYRSPTETLILMIQFKRKNSSITEMLELFALAEYGLQEITETEIRDENLNSH